MGKGEDKMRSDPKIIYRFSKLTRKISIFKEISSKIVAIFLKYQENQKKKFRQSGITILHD